MIQIDQNIQVDYLHLLDLVKDYKTPLYIYDEKTIINNIEALKEAFYMHFNNGKILYASKAADFTELYRICKRENIGADVVSIGEFYTALKAGMDPQDLYYHGNSKSIEELKYALVHKIGCIVMDSLDEIKRLKEIATNQKVLLRTNPNVDAHLHEAVSTAILDCKFGVALFTEEADLYLKEIADSPLDFAGFHYHIGSQIFEKEVFLKALQRILPFMKYAKEQYHLITRELNIGGGFPTPYLKGEEKLDLKSIFKELKDYLDDYCKENDLIIPQIIIEPGRSLVADAGLTLYKVNSVKSITGGSSYVAIDGGMTDNPRYALYGSKYTVLCANKLTEAHDTPFHLAGHCCESGDLIAKDILLPASIKADDYIVVLTTGAYNYSMASNYNRFLKPAVLMIQDEKIKEVVRKETLEDLVSKDL